MQTCKFCGRCRPFVKSHIIPRSFYEIGAFKQKAPRKTLSILSDSDDVTPTRRPDGLYDAQLFCQDCENKFMNYDDYAFKLLHENRNLKTVRDTDDEVLAQYYQSYDYNKLKLFFLSVFLRAGLSENFFFQHVTLGPHLDTLKRTIDAGKALAPNDFAVFLAYYGELKSGPVIFPPAMHRIEGLRFYCFHLGRVIFYIKPDKRKPPSGLMRVILKPETPLYLIRFELQSSHAHEVLNRIIKNPANLKYFSG